MPIRDRLILELLARGGMRVGEILKLTPADIDDIVAILERLYGYIPKYGSLRGARNPLGGFISAFSEIFFSWFSPEITDQSNQ